MRHYSVMSVAIWVIVTRPSVVFFDAGLGGGGGRGNGGRGRGEKKNHVGIHK